MKAKTVEEACNMPAGSFRNSVERNNSSLHDVETERKARIQASREKHTQQIKTVPRRTSPRTGAAIWMKFECGAGSRWTSVTEDDTGTPCNFSGCNCGTTVRFMGDTDDPAAHWFGLKAGAIARASGQAANGDTKHPLPE